MLSEKTAHDTTATSDSDFTVEEIKLNSEDDRYYRSVFMESVGNSMMKSLKIRTAPTVKSQAVVAQNRYLNRQESALVDVSERSGVPKEQVIELFKQAIETGECVDVNSRYSIEFSSKKFLLTVWKSH